MPRDTSQFTVDAVGDPEPITVPVRCRRLTIRDYSASGEWQIRFPLITSPAVKMGAGESYTFMAPPIGYEPDRVLGYANMVVGSAVFDKICDDNDG